MKKRVIIDTRDYSRVLVGAGLLEIGYRVVQEIGYYLILEN